MATGGGTEEDERSRAIAAQRPYLLRFAMLHLRDAAQAEDAVQDSLMAALAQRDRFAGRAQLRTWLTGILKHKIVDHVRRRDRTVPAGLLAAAEDGGPGAEGGPFDAAGRWAEPPERWEHPESALEATQFWRVYEECCRLMPARQALVFSLREVLQMTSQEICKELGISASNLHVILFRARLRLRECMTKNWFAGDRE
jgi:RNA polymerase sigma-70 factor (ECF subfamily)